MAAASGPAAEDGTHGAAASATRCRGALLGTFVGDALGARWEGAATAASWEEGRRRLERSAAQSELVYTDDTQMMLALAAHLVEHPEVDVDLLAHAFVDHYEASRGYGGGTVRVLRALRSGQPADRAARAGFPDGSLGNGAAMRVAPVGVRWSHDRPRLIAAARRSALPTHVHPQGVDGAVVVAAAVGHAAGGGTFGPGDLGALAQGIGDALRSDEVRRHLDDAAALADDDAWGPAAQPSPTVVADRLGVSATAARSVGTALWVAATAADAPDAVARALALGGDADTIAAMATAVLGAASGAHALPAAWLERAENGTRGRDRCAALADRLSGRSD